MYPKVQKCRRRCYNEGPGDSQCEKDITGPPKVVLKHWVRPQGAKKHVQTNRGRVLAEGDVDPAAGSRDEPTRLPVESPVAERKQAFEVQVHKVFVLEVK